MASELIVDRLHKLESKVKKMLSQYHSLNEKLAESKLEVESLKKILAEKDEEIKNFQNQHKITKIVSSIADETHENTELKLKINEFIREIDKCIAHLSE